MLKPVLAARATSNLAALSRVTATSVLCLIAAALPEATAGTITFEGHGSSLAEVQFQDGFTFTFDAWGYGIIEDSYAPTYNFTHNGTTRLVVDGYGTEPLGHVDIERTDGSAFTLVGLDAATMWFDYPLWGMDYLGGISVLGFTGGGSVVSASFSIDNVFRSFVLPATFTDLVRVRISDFSYRAYGDPPPGSFSVDNIVYAVVPEPVPEPATLLLLGTGLGAVAARRRLKKRRVALTGA